MNKRVGLIIAIVSLFLSFLLVDNSYAAKIYGSAKEKIITLSPGVSPVSGDPMAEVKEGYIHNGRRAVLDTLSSKEKEMLGVDAEKKLFIVVYESAYTGESSFIPGQDKLGNDLKRQVFELRFKYRENQYFSVDAFDSSCERLGDTPAHLKKLNEERWRRFYEEHTQFGMSDDDIKSFWEVYKEQNPHLFGSPKSDNKGGVR